MSYENDRAAYTLARVYNFLPEQKAAGRGPWAVDGGKYEPDGNEAAESRTMIIASYTGRSNLLIKFNPAELEPE